MNSIDPNILRKKAINAVNQDGLVDIIIGVLLLAISAYFYLEACCQIDLIMLLILPGLVVGPIVMKLRKKYTYPRTGYVNLKTKKNLFFKFLLIFFIAFLGFLAFYVLFNKSDEALNKILPYFSYLPLIIGIFLLLSYLNFAFSYKLTRYYIYCIVALVSIVFSQLITPVKIYSFIIMLFIQSLVFLSVGVYTFLRFLRNNPVNAYSDIVDQQPSADQENIRDSLKIIYADGWQEIMTAFFSLVWIIVILLPGLNNYWLYSILILNPLIMSLILFGIRKKRTHQLVKELTDSRVDLLGFASFFYFLFILGLGIFAISSLRNNYETRFLIIFFPLILALLTGYYYLINAVRYNISRFNLYTLFFFLVGLITFLVIGKPLMQLLLILVILSVLMIILGYKHRIKAE